MLKVAVLAIIVSMAMVLLRGLLGKTVYDRILAVNVFGTNAVIIIGLIGMMMGNPSFLDIALIYALINFITTIALLRFFRIGTFGIQDVEKE
ncbi:MAG: multiple resistance and pH regulation protein [Rickettsiales bacterium]|jgi:multicomponent Na+:H+ antiporter subunit F|nr:multiple resistance and pH regulation protein [Rickettsiales bacterium]